MSDENYYEVFAIGNHAGCDNYSIKQAFSLKDAHAILKDLKFDKCGKRPRKFHGTNADDEDAPLVFFEIVQVVNGYGEDDAIFKSDWYYARK